MQNRENKKRKGISLSVTPHKQNHAVNERPASTPKNSTIELQQSFVNVEQYIRPMNSQVLRSSVPYRPNVVFRYSNVSKENEQNQTKRLDYEIQNLQKQITEKRAVVHQIRNESLVCSQKPKFQIQQDKIKTFAKVNEIPLEIKQNKKKQELRPKIPSPPKKQRANVEESQVKLVEYGRQVKQKKKQVSPRKDKIKRKEEEVQEKENQTISERRQAKLKWAEEKLMQIIKVCDEGL